MHSAFFRKPGEDSSESSSEDDEVQDVELSKPSDEDASDGAELGATESLSSNASFNIADTQDERAVPNVDQHRDLMLATLLEDFYRTRAAELINSNIPGANFDRQSPEVQSLASKLYVDASQALTANGLLPATTTSEGMGSVRRQYLTGLDSLSLRKLQDADLRPTQRLQDPDNNLAVIRTERRGSHEIANLLDEPMRSIVMKTGRMSIASPHADMALSLAPPQHSHYESSFQQLKLLGKGGFGKVYHAFNVFDKKEYAVKKIPLSPKLSQRYKESGHQELESVLREVQALAQLDHNNVVRYHATWIEEPQSSPAPTLPSFAPPRPRFAPPRPRFAMPQQRLLEDGVIAAPLPRFGTIKSPPKMRVASSDHSDGIVFGSDSASGLPPRPFPNGFHEWSSHHLSESTSARESEIFTDGQARPSLPSDTAINNSVYVLHVQMSMYPMTLSQYLSPPPLNSTSALSNPTRRHCFHLVPALQILLGILCGLQYIHAKGLIHRDIKPSNIFIASTHLNSEGFHDVGLCAACPEQSHSHFINPRIGDFGLVAELARSQYPASNDPHDSNSGSNDKAAGTEYYRPPPPSSPVSSTPQVDESLDVFALGVILVELLHCCGTASERMHVLRGLQNEKLPRGLAVMVDSEGGHAEGTGAKVEECILGMIAREQERRWGCERVKEAVEGILAGCSVRPRSGRRNENGKFVKVRSLSGTEEAEAEAEAEAAGSWS